MVVEGVQVCPQGPSVALRVPSLRSGAELVERPLGSPRRAPPPRGRGRPGRPEVFRRSRDTVRWGSRVASRGPPGPGEDIVGFPLMVGGGRDGWEDTLREQLPRLPLLPDRRYTPR